MSYFKAAGLNILRAAAFKNRVNAPVLPIFNQFSTVFRHIQVVKERISANFADVGGVFRQFSNIDRFEPVKV